MKQTLLQEKYPVYTMTIGKHETHHSSAGSIIAYLRTCIERHEIARFIAEFDHYTHTNALPEGHIADEILDAKHVIFCFGTHLPNAQVMAVRPRSIGVVEQADQFVISFLEAPMALANNAMEAWVKNLVSTPVAA
jgi:hypothetical protein